MAFGANVALVAGPERVLEQDLEGVGEPFDVEAVLQGVEAEDLVLPASDAQRRACGEGVGHRLDSSGRACDQDASLVHQHVESAVGSDAGRVRRVDLDFLARRAVGEQRRAADLA